jgi:precorrin-6Y C5,15-methyltransferase (decarboxylating)
MKRLINVVGMGLSPEDLAPRAIKIIMGADILAGGKRHLSFFPDHSAMKVVIDRNVEATLAGLKKSCRGKRVVVLASGDPNFYGVAPLVCKVFGKKNVSVLPNITAFQAACARVRQNWEDAMFISLHGRPISQLDNMPADDRTVVLYCDGNNTPARVARYLVGHDKGFKNCQTWVFENLGQQDERISDGILEKFINYSAAALSMMIIKTKKGAAVHCGETRIGIPDSEFCHDSGMITKRDARILTLSRLGCGKNQVLWDIGAGSGSISIEAARLYPGIEVYAIERNRERFSQLEKNIKKFRTAGVRATLGSAPAALKKLPRPHSVFVGGSGGNLPGILQEIKKRISKNGNLVVNCITITTLSQVLQILKKWQWNYTAASVQIAHLTAGDQPEIFRAENPLFIVHGTAA